MELTDKQMLVVKKDCLYTIEKTNKDGAIEIEIKRIDSENIEDNVIKLFVEI